MLSSIHPLGERSRDNRWSLTVGAFTLGAGSSGALLGGVAGLLGSVLLGPSSLDHTLLATGAVAAFAALLDFARIRPPGPSRQVNENWIGALRGWVYGGGFGAQLGLGMTTYVVTWGVYASIAGAVLSASPAGGVGVGAVFGLGRSVSLWLAGRVDRPSRLVSFNQRLVTAGQVVTMASSVGLTAIGAMAVWLAAS